MWVCSDEFGGLLRLRVGFNIVGIDQGLLQSLVVWVVFCLGWVLRIGGVWCFDFVFCLLGWNLVYFGVFWEFSVLLGCY